MILYIIYILIFWKNTKNKIYIKNKKENENVVNLTEA